MGLSELRVRFRERLPDFWLNLGFTVLMYYSIVGLILR